MNVTDIEIEGEYFSSDFADAVVVDPDESFDLTVTFAPEAGGDFEGTLTIVSDDPYTPQITVSLTGTGWVYEIVEERGSLLEFFGN